MLTGIDHVVIAVPDPDAAAATLERDLGIEVGPGGRHEGLGTFNRLAWFGDTYLELIGVYDAEEARRSWFGAPTLDAQARGGGLVTWVIGSDSVNADAAALVDAGSTLGTPVAGERRRPDGRVVRWRLARPPEVGAGAPFIIEHDTTAAEWTAPERAVRASARHPAGGQIRLEALEVVVPDVTVASRRLRREVGLSFRPSLAGGGARDAQLGPHTIRLRPSRGEPAGAAVLRLAGPGAPDRTIERFGCRWVLRPR